MSDSLWPYGLDCSPSDPSVHGISQAKILEWVVIFFSRASSWTREQMGVSWTASGFFAAEPPENIVRSITQYQNTLLKSSHIFLFFTNFLLNDIAYVVFYGIYHYLKWICCDGSFYVSAWLIMRQQIKHYFEMCPWDVFGWD